MFVVFESTKNTDLYRVFQEFLQSIARTNLTLASAGNSL